MRVLTLADFARIAGIPFLLVAFLTLTFMRASRLGIVTDSRVRMRGISRKVSQRRLLDGDSMKTALRQLCRFAMGSLSALVAPPARSQPNSKYPLRSAFARIAIMHS